MHTRRNCPIIGIYNLDAALKRISGVLHTHSREMNKTAPWITVPKKVNHLELTFKGDGVIQHISKCLKFVFKRTYNSTDSRILNSTSRLPISSVKIRIPIHATPHCMHQFRCSCGVSYIGRTGRCLNDRIKEHVPSWVEHHLMSKIDNASWTDQMLASSIARHLIESSHQVDLESVFSVVYRETKSRNLNIVEAVAVSRLKPELCVLEKLFVTLRLPWGYWSLTLTVVSLNGNYPMHYCWFNYLCSRFASE